MRTITENGIVYRVMEWNEKPNGSRGDQFLHVQESHYWLVTAHRGRATVKVLKQKFPQTYKKFRRPLSPAVSSGLVKDEKERKMSDYPEKCEHCKGVRETLCREKRNSFVCTKQKGHPGDHFACGLRSDEHPIIAWDSTGKVTVNNLGFELPPDEKKE